MKRNRIKEMLALTLAMVMMICTAAPAATMAATAPAGTAVHSATVDMTALPEDSDEFVWVTEEDIRRTGSYSEVGGLCASTAVSTGVSGTASTGLYKSQFSGLGLAIYETLEKNRPAASNSQISFVYPLNGQNPETAKNEFRSIWAPVMYGYQRDHVDALEWNDNAVGIRGFRADSQYLYATLAYSVSPYYTASLSSQLKSRVDSIVKGCTGTTRYQKLKYYHDWLANNNIYDQRVTTEEQMYYSHSQAGCLLKGKGVCESYAKAFKIFCMRENIPCLIVTSPSHAFNYVKMEDGRWYMVDVTWDDPIGASKSNYNYFLVTNDPPATGSHVLDTTLRYPATGSAAYKAPAAGGTVQTTAAMTMTMRSGSCQTGGETAGTPESSEAEESSKTPETSAEVIAPAELPAPKLDTVSNTTSGVKVTWEAIPGATSVKYRLFRKVPGGSWCEVTDTTGLSATDKTAKSGTTYYYTVRAISTETGEYASTFDKTGKKILYLAACKPTLTNVSGGVKLTWTQATGAAGYYIYRLSGTTGTYAKIATVKGSSTVTYTDSSAKSKNGSGYTYAVRAYSGTIRGGYTGVFTCRMTGVSINSLKNVSGRKMKLTWGKNGKASGYQIQYSLKSDMSSASTVTVSGASNVTKTISSLTKGKYTYVRVRAYKTNGSSKLYSAWSSVKKVKISK